MNHLATLATGLTFLSASVLGAEADCSSPDKHPEAYEQFSKELAQMQQAESSDYYAAVNIILECTGDETAVDAWMEKAATEKQAAAMLYIANQRISDIFINQDSAEAIQAHCALLQEAADSAYIPAIIYRSTCIAAGLGQEADQALALKLLEPACSLENNEARFKWLQLAGKMRMQSDLSRPEVVSEIERDNDCVMMYASMLTTNSDLRMQNLQDAAELGNADAYYTLGITIADTNPQQSYQMMSQAAQLHHADAMAVVGGIESSPIKAGAILAKAGAEFKAEEGIEMLQLASMMGSSMAHVMLGDAYLKGSELTPKDEQRAFYHIQRATAGSDGNAALAYTYMLMKGIGCEARPEFAIELCRALLSRDIKRAVILYAYAYYKGLGVEADAAQASEILQEAATLNQPEAYVYLAFITNKGVGKLKANPKQAEIYLKMAELDLKDKAKELYQKIEADGDWHFSL